MKTETEQDRSTLPRSDAPTTPPSDFAERLVTLCDGRRGLRGGLRTEVSEPRQPQSAVGNVLDFIASDETLDRYDEIIVASGWHLDHYRRNPVFQNAHQYGDILFTLGKALLTEIRDGKLYQRIEFATECNPLAKIAYGLYKGKFLNAVSVGFFPLRWENGSADAGFRRKYLEQELLEVSAVGIPANPNALQLGLKAGAIEKADLQALLDVLRGVCRASPALPQTISFRSDPAVPNTHASASGVRGNEAQWLQLARALRQVLRRT